MKKIFVIVLLVSFAAVSVALAAVSSPCGARKPAPAAPRAPEEDQFKRDILRRKVPTQTAKEGDALNDEATKYEHTLVTGNEK